MYIYYIIVPHHQQHKIQNSSFQFPKGLLTTNFLKKLFKILPINFTLYKYFILHKSRFIHEFPTLLFNPNFLWSTFSFMRPFIYYSIYNNRRCKRRKIAVQYYRKWIIKLLIHPVPNNSQILLSTANLNIKISSPTWNKI